MNVFSYNILGRSKNNGWQVRKSFIERYYQELSESGFWTLNKKICFALVVLLMTVLMLTGCTKNVADEELIPDNSQQEEILNEGIKTGNDGVNAAIAPDDEVSIVSNQDNYTGTMVAMSIEDIGRSDPFLPEGERVASLTPSIDLLPPPETITVDEVAKEIITTKVSGIMYDKFNPSALLNIGESDYLVRTGDIIDGYKVLSIAKDNVTVQRGANIYKAGVGEMFSGDGMNYNTISNLESKFGGSKNVANKR